MRMTKPKVVCTLPSTQSQVDDATGASLAYMTELLAQLRVLAQRDGHDFLAHLIAMAAEEARLIAARPSDQSDAVSGAALQPPPKL